jgi:hypothetical protein
VRVHWETIAKDSNAYVARYTVELTSPVQGVLVKVVESEGWAPEPGTPYAGTALLDFKCKWAASSEWGRWALFLHPDGRSESMMGAEIYGAGRSS